jgi:hypothetical protein
MNEILKEFLKKNLWTIVIIVALLFTTNAGTFFFGRGLGERVAYKAVEDGLKSVREFYLAQEEHYQTIEETSNAIAKGFDGIAATFSDFSSNLNQYNDSVESGIGGITERIVSIEVGVENLEATEEGDTDAIRRSREAVERLSEIFEEEQN